MALFKKKPAPFVSSTEQVISEIVREVLEADPDLAGKDPEVITELARM